MGTTKCFTNKNIYFPLVDMYNKRLTNNKWMIRESVHLFHSCGHYLPRGIYKLNSPILHDFRHLLLDIVNWWHHNEGAQLDDITMGEYNLMTSQWRRITWWHHNEGTQIDDITMKEHKLMTSQWRSTNWWHHNEGAQISDIKMKGAKASHI